MKAHDTLWGYCTGDQWLEDSTRLYETSHDSLFSLAQGRPECSRRTCMLVCAFFCALCTRDRGCSAHPVFPAPSISREGETYRKPRAHHAARMETHVQAGIAMTPSRNGALHTANRRHPPAGGR